ncbi:DUF6705 family protein [Mangrovimonas cancribranchiae]|uniref:DUF6705 family protein n=1 Tax=Mangrovimonas cancribranchiae TaxID=3080055 RepID=A0AAU6P6P2_9FLAO
MKHILITLTIFFILLSCKAQTLPLYNPPNGFNINNAYYKDLDGDLTKLVGTWKYTNGNEVFQIILKIQEYVPYNSSVLNISNHEDELYGEYQYIDSNGNEVINTLNNIDNNIDVYDHLINGAYIKGKNYFPPCNDCTVNERRVSVTIEDPLRFYFDYELEIRHIPPDPLNNTPEQIKVIVRNNTHFVTIPTGQPNTHRLPFGEFILIKQ